MILDGLTITHWKEQCWKLFEPKLTFSGVGIDIYEYLC